MIILELKPAELYQTPMKRFPTLLLFCLLNLYVNAWAGALNDILERKTLRVGMEPGYMPFGLIAENDEIIGFDVDIAAHMARAMGVKLEIVKTSWDDIIPDLVANEYDIIISGMTLTQRRNLRVNFASPYIVIGQTVLLRKALEERVQSYEDLNKAAYKVAFKAGTTSENAVKKFMPKPRQVPFKVAQEGVMALINGKVDAFVYDAPFNAIANIRYGKEKLIFLDEPFTFEPLAWAIRPGDPDFLNWLNNFVIQIENDGTYEELYQKWFWDEDWLQRLP